MSVCSPPSILFKLRFSSFVHVRPRRFMTISQQKPPSVLSGGIALQDKFTIDTTTTNTLIKHPITPSPSTQHTTDPTDTNTIFTRAKEWVRSNTILVFFPRDYPHSVTPNFLPFVKYQFLGSICGTVNSILGTQALLYGLGMGAGAIPLAAGLNWIIKDGLGLLGGVVYTSVFSGKFDSEPKRYRFKASLALQVATFCELLIPLVPNLFLVLASASNIAKNVSWLTMSGCRAQMHQSFCLKDSLGDVTAKSGSQNTAAGLIGTGLGIIASALVGNSVEKSLMVFVPLALGNMYYIYLSNCAVITKSFNIQRAELVFSHYLKNQSIPTPKAISGMETFVHKYKSPFDGSIVVNAPLYKSEITAEELKKAIHETENSNYVLLKRSKTCFLWLTQNASSRDTLEAIYNSCKLRLDNNAGSSVEFNEVFDKLRNSEWNVDEVVVGENGRISVEAKTNE